jgi:uncharacterized protein YbdZ (MbtH family)
MRMVAIALLAFAGIASTAVEAAAAKRKTYAVAYEVELRPRSGIAHVTMTLTGQELPSRLTFLVDPERHRNFTATGDLETAPDRVVWSPPLDKGTLSFDFRIEHALAGGTRDSYLAEDWAVFRGDRLVPPIRTLASTRLYADTTLHFTLPAGWSVVTRYPERGPLRYAIDDPSRRFERPTGWMIAGKTGARQAAIAGVSATVATPARDSARRQETLAFLGWNLPHVTALFPSFPKRLLVVRAGDPMFRGGLSGPGSLFLHSDRPMVTENRTSPLLHELVHVAMGISGDDTSDWIVEGFAEYYSIELLRRSGGISAKRFKEATALQDSRGQRAPDLFVPASTGAVTARAVTVMLAVDAEIRQATRGKASLDDVAREFAKERGEVSLSQFQALAAKVAGRPVRALDRATLAGGR